jgi:hypothetical protein
MVTGERDFDEVLLAIGDTLFDRTYHIASFADTNANLTTLISHHNDGSEAHLFAAFDSL